MPDSKLNTSSLQVQDGGILDTLSLKSPWRADIRISVKRQLLDSRAELLGLDPSPPLMACVA